MKVKFDQQQKPIPSHILSNSVHCCYTLIFLLCLYLGSFTNPRIASFLISVPSVFIISLTVFLILSNCFISSNQEILIKMEFKAPRLQFNNNTGKNFSTIVARNFMVSTTNGRWSILVDNLHRNLTIMLKFIEQPNLLDLL